MNRTRVKICGLRDKEGVLACREAGADAVGFVFYAPSVRAVKPSLAGVLATHLGPWQTPVALFVDPDVTLVQDVLKHIPNALLQFHGNEEPAFCESFGRPFMKAVRMCEGLDLINESRKFYRASGLLVDSWSEGFGGSGHTFEWSMLPDASKLAQPLILSGGLNTENICQALSEIRPYGVDVSSGVEASRGVKCSDKIRGFCTAVQHADHEILMSSHLTKQDPS